LKTCIASAMPGKFRPTRILAVDIALTFFWIIGLTNAFNLIDNMDGLCARVTIIMCVFRFVAAAQSGDATGALILAILAGAFLGFLIFNYKPARSSWAMPAVCPPASFSQLWQSAVSRRTRGFPCPVSFARRSRFYIPFFICHF
jgi:energy-converting hydrogenase Eha subunit A